MTHRGPFQPLTFCDSVNKSSWSDSSWWMPRNMSPEVCFYGSYKYLSWFMNLLHVYCLKNNACIYSFQK